MRKRAEKRKALERKMDERGIEFNSSLVEHWREATGDQSKGGNR